MVIKHISTQQHSLNGFKLRPLSASIRLAVAGGLLIGGLPLAYAELPIPAQVWATMGVASHQVLDNGSTLHIDQQSQNAILNWEKFNVGAQNKVEFNQPNSTAIALNRIFDGNPSQILGKLTANGQIYLYNQNGFVFGKDSSVNVNTLVTSTLNIAEDTLNTGLTQQTGLGIDKPALGANDSSEPATKAGSFIRIEKGAKIHAQGDANSDGLVIMAAPSVDNKGSISTNEFGQVILVASQDKVYLQPADNQSPFSGLLVEVDTGGKVSNVGDIFVRQGNITLEGFAVNQGGRLTATTSVNVNGSIRLLAQEKHVNDGGKLFATRTVRDAEHVIGQDAQGNDITDGLGTQSKVTFDTGSSTQILADTDTKDTAIDEKAQAQSYMDVIANQIQMKSGAEIVAPYGNINMVATNDLSVIDRRTNQVVLPTTASDSPHRGRILIDKDAKIDVSGLRNIKVDMERNVGEVSVQSFDLRDSPFQKGGVLQGKTIRVDTRQENPIVDTTGAKNGVQRSIEERLTQGGSINLSSNGDVILNSGAVVNIAGGSVNYRDGYINTTKLLTDYGRIVDISEADPDQHYVSVFGVVTEVHEKWGVTRTWENAALLGQGRFEKGYTEGKSAGSINIQSPLLSWNANLIAGSTAGFNQRDIIDRPFGGAFILNEIDGDNTIQRDYVSSQDVLFQAKANTVALGIDDDFPNQKNGLSPRALVFSNAMINKSGIQKLLIKTRGDVKFAQSTAINIKGAGNAKLADKTSADGLGANIALDAGSFAVNGSIYAPGGSITLKTNTSDTTSEKLGKIILSQSAVLDVSGQWINDFKLSNPVEPISPLPLDGGTVNLVANGDLTLSEGSEIRANGGAHLSVDNILTEGKGGAIQLAAVGFAFPSSVQLNGKLSAWGLSEGGSLSLSSGKIIVGTNNLAPETEGFQPLVLAVNDGELSQFADSGFSKIHLESHDDSLVVSGDARLNLLAKNRQFDIDLRLPRTARSLIALTHVETLPEHLRNPVDLSLSALDDVIVETGSEIIGDTGASINLASSQGGIYVDGKISAPAGEIDLTIKTDLEIYDSTQAIWLGPHARLLAKGATEMQPTDSTLNRRIGEVLDGGKINLVANRGYVIQEKGALIFVSGIKSKLDLPVTNAQTGDISYRAKTVASNAGSIAITAGEGIVLEGALKGSAGSKTTQNGRFDLTLNPQIRNFPSDNLFLPSNQKVIKVTQHRESILNGQYQFGDKLDDFVNPAIPFDEDSLNGKAYVSSYLIRHGEFDDVRLISPDEVRFVGSVDLSTKQRIELSTQKVGWEAVEGSKANAVSLNSVFLKAGWEGNSPNSAAFDAPLELGFGKLAVGTKWTELVGSTRWDGFKQIKLRSSDDLRVRGVEILSNPREYQGGFMTAANLNIRASQIYPTTLTEFAFEVDKNVNPEGAISIFGKNTTETPLSANGILSFAAPVINQNGILKAPFGTINLNASTSLNLGPKSLTSVSADGKAIPFGNTSGSLFWIYPWFNNTNLVFNESSQGFRPIQTKQVNLSSPEVTLAEGSQIDISGGGDLRAFESIPNSAGGTYDYLSLNSPAYQGGFAVVPSENSDLAPSEPARELEIAAGKANYEANYESYYAVGNQIYLSGTDQLPAGNYTIMPARYALLPGAFLVTPQANSQDQTRTIYNTAGQAIVSGYVNNAATGTRDSRTSGFLIESGSDVRKRSEYKEVTANAFFAERSLANNTSVPLIPKDSGQVTIDQVNKLILEGSINSTPATDTNSQGRGGKLDIATNSTINIVNSIASEDSEALEIKADDLNNLNLDSLFLGGVRSRDNATGETKLAVKATEVNVDNGVQLKVKDLLVAAKNQVTIKSAAALTASGTVNTGDTIFNVSGYGALLRVSSDQQVSLSSASTRNTEGSLAIEEGAVINGLSSGTQTTLLKSVLLDASKTTRLDGEIKMQGGSLSLNANAINIGEVANINNDALKLSNQQLSLLLVDELLLNSRGSVNFYGNVGQVDAKGNLLTDNGLIQPLQFDHLVINAGGFSGFDNQGKTARIQADSLAIQNLTNALATAGSGNGQLELLTNDYTQGAGQFAITGFNNININPASEQASRIRIEGESTVNVSGNLTIKTDYLTAVGGSEFNVNALGHSIAFNNAGFVDTAMSSGFGAAVSLHADTVNFNTTALLYSGKLDLHARQGNVTVGEQAVIDLTGKAVKFADVVEYTPGGTFSAQADQGKITLAANSKLDLSTAGGDAAGGQLVLKAPKQTVDLLGFIKAASGSAVIDIATLGQAGQFDNWMSHLGEMGISDSIYFRLRQTDIVQAAGQTIKANEVTLVADKGKIDLSGAVNTNGVKDGGNIELYAGDKVILQNSALLSAKGGTGKGGDVLLSSVDSDSDGISGIALNAGSGIDVSGFAGQGGDVVLRALRDTDKVLKIDPIAANTVKGASQYFAEGIKKYTNADIANGEIDAGVIAAIKTDTDSYMSAANIQKTTDTIDSKISLRAGIDIAYEGDLTVKDSWDFMQWRYGDDLTGNLVINASGKLTVANSLTDAYAPGIFGQPALQGGNSWSYQLAAGADLTSADNFATINVAGNNLELQGTRNNPVVIRTGIGDIKLAAGGDVVFKNQYAAVYSAGRPTATDPKGTLGDYLNNFSSEYFTLFNSEYAVDGGNVIIKAENNIQGVVSDQFITPWLLRSGNWGSETDPELRKATAWGVDITEFGQNVGSFGGGAVTVQAGGNVTDLSVMMPSTGKQVGKIVEGVTKSDGFNPIFENNDVEIGGGGQLNVKAGGDIAGGAYLLGKGEGSISADGRIKGGRQFVNGPQLVMGDSNLQLTAKQDLSITAVSDQMSISNEIQFYSYTETSGITVKSLSGDVRLGADTSVILSQINLDPISNENQRETGLYPSSLETTAFGGDIIIDEINLFPSTSGRLSLFANQNIKPNEASINPGNLIMLDADIRLIATALTPVLGSVSIVEPLTSHTPRIAGSVDLLHKNDKEPVRLVTTEGDIANIKATLAKKAIIQAGRDLSNVRLDIQNINTDDVTVLSAGRDISYTVKLNEIGTLDVVTNLSADSIQISGPGDVLVKTGRNLDLGVSNGLLTVGNKFNSNLDSKGANITVLSGLNGHDLNYSGFVSKYLAEYPSDNNFDEVSGLITDFMRERLANSELSTSDSLKLFANLKPEDYAPIQTKINALILPVYENNSNLSYQGITNKEIIDSIKGIGEVSYDSVIDKYLQHFAVAEKFNGAYSIVTDFMRDYTNNDKLTEDQALALFKTLESDDYLSIQQQLNNAVLPVYYNEIKESGSASASDKDAGNDRAFIAINTLFPGSELKTEDEKFPWQGDVNLTFSTLQTVEGGNIDLLVPGGKVTAGLSFVFPGLENKQPSDLGIIAQKEGDINAVIRDNFAVNLSRVFTQQSGNIAIWSTEGDIDAGRGAKTALSVPETLVNYSGGGKTTIVRPAVSGSGVRAAASANSVAGQGDVFLFAPGGVVNAGEAGIGGSNVTISAVSVLGANNIQVGGVSTGVPTASVGSLAAGLSGVSNLSASVSQIAQAATDTSPKDTAEKADKTAKLGVLNVEFIGYGDEDPNEKKNKPKATP